MVQRPSTTEPVEESELIPIGQASRLFPSRPAPATLYRWVTKGCRMPDGRLIRLESIASGRRRFIAPAAARSFLDACNELCCGAASSPAGAAGRALEALGC